MGKKCHGVATDRPDVKLSRLYCEGRDFAAESGTLVNASGTTGVVANNNALTWTADSYGVTPTVHLVDPGENDASLAVSVVGSVITVSLATDAGGDITTTAADVITAIGGDADAAALVDVANTDTSTGAAAVVAEAVNLSGQTPGFVGDDADAFAAGVASWTTGSGVDCCAREAGGGA